MINGDKIKQKILFINLYNEIGGGEVGLINILKNLDKNKFEPVVLCNKSGTLSNAIREIGVQVEIIPFVTVMLQKVIYPNIFLKNLKASWQIRKFIKEYKINVVQCNDVLSLLLLLPSMMLHRVRVVFNVIFFYERMRALLLNILAFFGIKYIVVLSNIIKKDLLRKTFGLLKRIRLIYWGVDTTQFKPINDSERKLVREKLCLPIDKKIIGFIGRYEIWKGHETFLRAAAQLVNKRDDLHFIIVGGATTEEIVPAVSRYRNKITNLLNDLNLKDKLTFLGHRNDIPDIMNCLDVCVCPSDYEPFGLVVLEALACGVPVVVSSTVGALEVLNKVKNVFVAEPRNPISFSNAIINALKLEKNILTDRYLMDILNQLSWSACVRKYEQLYM